VFVTLGDCIATGARVRKWEDSLERSREGGAKTAAKAAQKQPRRRRKNSREGGAKAAAKAAQKQPRSGAKAAAKRRKITAHGASRG
jgi:hypothetical protein